MLTLMAESSGAIWAGTSRGLYRVVETAGSVRLSAQAGVSGMVSTLLRDRDGVLWAGTWGSGIWRITDAGCLVVVFAQWIGRRLCPHPV